MVNSCVSWTQWPSWLEVVRHRLCLLMLCHASYVAEDGEDMRTTIILLGSLQIDKFYFFSLVVLYLLIWLLNNYDHYLRNGVKWEDAVGSVARLLPDNNICIYLFVRLCLVLFVQMYITFFKNIAQTNIAALVMCVVAMAIIYSVLRWVNPLVKQKIRMPLPIELIVVSWVGVTC